MPPPTIAIRNGRLSSFESILQMKWLYCRYEMNLPPTGTTTVTGARLRHAWYLCDAEASHVRLVDVVSVCLDAGNSAFCTASRAAFPISAPPARASQSTAPPDDINNKAVAGR